MKELDASQIKSKLNFNNTDFVKVKAPGDDFRGLLYFS
jgi:hypothetical protein